jgi:hypothetical protein
MRPRRLAIPALSLLAALSAPEAIARATPPRVVVLDAELRPVRGTLAGVAGSTVRVRESRSRVRTLERASLITFEPAAPARPAAVEPETALIDGDDQTPPPPSAPNSESRDEPSRPAGLLELTDGQRWPGVLVRAQGETLTWRGPAGVRDVPLERVRRWTLVPGIAPDISGARDDIVVLTNKDRLEGFVASVDSAAGQLTLERRGKAEPLRLDTIALIAPAAKDSDVASDAAPIMVWLRGEEPAIVAATDVTTDSPRGESTPRLSFSGTALGAIDPANISAIRLRANLAPLASIAASLAPKADSWQPEPIIRGEGPAAEIELLGPGEWTWTLPAGAARLSATVALASEATAWGDAAITIESADQRWTGTLTGAGPLERDATLSLRGTLRVRIEAGSSGAVGARVVLRRAVVETSR